MLIPAIFAYSIFHMYKEPTQQFILADTGKRILAFFIDHISLTGLMVLLAFALLGDKFGSMQPNKFMVGMSIVFIPGFFIYFAKDSFGGMSFGKRMLGIMVRSANDKNEIPSFGRLFLRNLTIILWPVECLVLLADSNKQRLGDKLASTVVVQNPDKLPRRTRGIILLVAAVVSFACFSFCVGYIMKQSDAYKLAVKEITVNKDIIAETGGVRGFGMMPGGNVSTTNNSGVAYLQITVIGNKKDIKVEADLIKNQGSDWQLVNLRKLE